MYYVIWMLLKVINMIHVYHFNKQSKFSDISVKEQLYAKTYLFCELSP